MDIGYIKVVVSHAAAVHGVRVQVEPSDLGRIALKRLGLVGKGRERDRCPTLDELQALADYFASNARQIIPLERIMRFAIATALRQDEICRIRWEDIDAKACTVIVRDRKDPRAKNGNDRKVPLLDVTGFDAWAVLGEQKPFCGNNSLVFPYNGRSVETAFQPACEELMIEDLRFHDLRPGHMPKGIDISGYSQHQLNAMARQLNERPRKTLDFQTPAEMFSESVALIS